MKQTQYTIPKKLITIQDMAGVGRCSMTVALPVISACKVQACPVPTSIFSNHTGFEIFHKTDLTTSLSEYLNAIHMIPVSYDGIYCGYLGSFQQIKLVASYIKAQNITKDLFVLIDPIMGDHGKRYRTITTEFCHEMKLLLPYASIITPNITEACLLTDTPYHEGIYSEEELLTLSEKLVSLGASSLVITGMKDDSHFYNFIYESSTSYTMLSAPIAGESRPGTGDIFASIIAAKVLSGMTLINATKQAIEFIALCTKVSSDLNIPVQEGVAFEMVLSELV